MRALLFPFAAVMPAAAAIAQVANVPDATNLALRAGSWSYAATQAGSQASFMDTSGTAQLILRCIRANRAVVVSMRAVPAVSMQVWTSSMSRSVPATYDPASAHVNISLGANDPLLDAIAFSRGRISFSVNGISPLVLPAWPEPARAIEDCRN